MDYSWNNSTEKMFDEKPLQSYQVIKILDTLLQYNDRYDIKQDMVL